jgi:hypothetical protein
MFAVADTPAPAEGEIQINLTSPYCGPRCVHRVLREYDMDVALIDLIREIQMPGPSAGSSMLDLASALERRGIQTRAVHIDPDQYSIVWDHPAIVHVQNEGVDHYVVWLPPRDAGGHGSEDAWCMEERNCKTFCTFKTMGMVFTCDHPGGAWVDSGAAYQQQTGQESGVCTSGG